MLNVVKTLIAALVIVAVGEISKRSSSMLAAFLLALPIVSIVALVWIYLESKDKIKIADISQETFWHVIPTLPMFLLFGWMLTNNYNFYLSLFICCVLTAGLFAITQYLLVRV
jgi:uncharacterized membrane protein (GlpM family)